MIFYLFLHENLSHPHVVTPPDPGDYDFDKPEATLPEGVFTQISALLAK